MDAAKVRPVGQYNSSTFAKTATQQGMKAAGNRRSRHSPYCRTTGPVARHRQVAETERCKAPGPVAPSGRPAPGIAAHRFVAGLAALVAQPAADLVLNVSWSCPFRSSSASRRASRIWVKPSSFGQRYLSDRSWQCSTSPLRTTLRAVFREIPSSRAIERIDFSSPRCFLRIFAIVSTTNMP